ncbi:MAG: hypothetical protein JJ974_04385 [Phycisphaerales bacterium]|nr:hypothetical protein [Phycisphaerales bacterium]
MTKRFIHVAALVCSILAVTAHACLWDRDTLATEARGLPGITEIITGRFDRFPPLFYEMRLERVTGELADDPDNLDLYDDAGVACDRLGLSDEAIGWMERKLVVMDRLEAKGIDVSEHRYRYLANLGTFYVHRWLKNGASREDMADVERSRDLIAAAIELNPEAHFGRERYQLLAIKSLLLSDSERSEMTSFLGVISPKARQLSNYPDGTLLELGYADAAEGISGLIQLGSAWQSIEVYRALEYALASEGHGVLSMLAHLRVHELTEIQYRLDPSAPKPVELQDCEFPDIVSRYDAASLHDEFYIDARTEADAWTHDRNNYLTARLLDGRHPDTDPKFWSNWKETSSPPKLPDSSIWPVIFIGLGVIIVFALVVATFVVVVLKIIQFTRNALSA